MCVPSHGRGHASPAGPDVRELKHVAKSQSCGRRPLTSLHRTTANHCLARRTEQRNRCGVVVDGPVRHRRLAGASCSCAILKAWRSANGARFTDARSVASISHAAPLLPLEPNADTGVELTRVDGGILRKNANVSVADIRPSKAVARRLIPPPTITKNLVSLSRSSASSIS